MSQIKVLVVDDSAFMRKILTDLLSSDQDITVVGTARNGEDALKKAAQLEPDVITLDVEMPVMDGITALQELLRQRPVPVVMVSSLTQAGAETTIQALTLGAVDFVGKPSGHISLDMAKTRDELVRKVKQAAQAQVRVPLVGRPGQTGSSRPLRSARPVPPRPTQARPGVRPAGLGTRPPLPALRPAGSGPTPAGAGGGSLVPIIAIGCSTGGPGALHRVIPALPGDLPAAVLIVQHMPPGFTRSLADRLNDLSALTVKEAAGGERLTAGQALIAPGGLHLTVDADGVVHLDDGPPQHGVRPAVDRLLMSLAAHHGPRTLAVIMTGMGFDGARGTAALREAGGRAVAEDQSTCVVYGMPRAVIELGQADRVVPLDDIPTAILEMMP